MPSQRLKLVLASLCLLLPTAVSAQQAMVVGTARTRTGDPVRGAYVSIEALHIGTVTNDDGAYRLVIPAAQAGGTVTIKFSSIGFGDATVNVDVTAGATVRRDIVMTEQHQASLFAGHCVL